MRPLPLVALALLVTVGCVEPSGLQTASTSTLAVATGAWTGGILDAKVFHTGEPSLAFDGKGIEYVCAPAGAQPSEPDLNFVWRSDDHGATFTKMPTTGRTFDGGGDCDIATDPTTGALYESGLKGGVLLPFWITFSASRDGGRTWTDSKLLNALPVTDREWVAATKGAVYVTWQQIDSGIWVARSTDGGVTFPVQTLAMPRYLNTDLQRYFIEGPLRAAPDGTLYVPDGSQNACDFWGCFDSAPGGNPTGHVSRGNVAVSTDGGLTWTIKPTKAPTGWAFTVDGRGTLWTGDVRCDRNETGNVTGCTPIVWSSKDKATTWQGPFNVTLPANMTVSHFNLAAGDDGKLAAAFYASKKLSFSDDDKIGDWDLYVAESLDGAKTWSLAKPLAEPVHVGVLHRDLVDFLSVAIDPTTGLPHVAYTTTTHITNKDDQGYGRIGEAHATNGPVLRAPSDASGAKAGDDAAATLVERLLGRGT